MLTTRTITTRAARDPSVQKVSSAQSLAHTRALHRGITSTLATNKLIGRQILLQTDCLMDSLMQASDHGMVSAVDFINFAKAFDRFPHIPLLYKLVLWCPWSVNTCSCFPQRLHSRIESLTLRRLCSPYRRPTRVRAWLLLWHRII